MKHFAFLQRLEKAPPAPLCVLRGEDPYLVRSALRRLRERLGGDACEEDRLSGTAITPLELEIAWAQGSLFATSRLLVLEEAGRFRQRHSKAWKGIMARPPTGPICIAALYKSGGKDLPEGPNLWVVDCWKPWASEMPQWAGILAGREGKTLAPDARDLLMTLCEQDLSMLDEAITRCALYLGERRKIERRDVEAQAGHPPEASPFDLAAAAADGDSAALWRLAARWRDHGGDPAGLIGPLRHEFWRRWLGLEAARQGKGPREIATAAGVRFQPEAWGRRAAHTPPERVLRGIEALRLLDRDIKGEGADAASALDCALLRMTRSDTASASRKEH